MFRFPSAGTIKEAPTVTECKVYTFPPFQMVTLRPFDSIFIPMPMKKLIMGVKAALLVIEEGHSVLV